MNKTQIPTHTRGPMSNATQKAIMAAAMAVGYQGQGPIITEAPDQPRVLTDEDNRKLALSAERRERKLRNRAAHRAMSKAGGVV